MENSSEDTRLQNYVAFTALLVCDSCLRVLFYVLLLQLFI